MPSLRSIRSVPATGFDHVNLMSPSTPRVPGHFPTPVPIPQDSMSDVQPTELTGRPRVNKAGLIVTAELEQAISRCRSKVQKLAKDCRRGNRRYRWVHFHPLSIDTALISSAPSNDISMPFLEISILTSWRIGIIACMVSSRNLARSMGLRKLYVLLRSTKNLNSSWMVRRQVILHKAAWETVGSSVL